MKTVKKLLIFVALTAGLTIPAYGAQYAHYARKAITAASWLGAYGIGCYFTSESMQPLCRTYGYYYGNILEGEIEPAPAAIVDFVHNVLQREGVPNALNTKIYIRKDHTRIAFACKTKKLQAISLHKEWANNFIQRNEITFYTPYGTTFTLSAEENIDHARAALTHEAAHIKNEDSKRGAIAGVAVASSSFFLSFAIAARQTRFPRSNMIAAGVAAYGASELLWNKFSRIIETEADDAITRVCEMKSYKRFLEESQPNPPQGILEHLKYGSKALLDDHPSYNECIKRLEQRLQEYEENN